MNVLNILLSLYFWADPFTSMTAIGIFIFLRGISKEAMTKSLNTFYFFVLINRQRYSPWPLIGRGIFVFNSASAEQNFKPGRKRVPHVLYQVGGFLTDLSTNVDAQVSNLSPYIFLPFFYNRWTEARFQGFLPSVLSVASVTTMAALLSYIYRLIYFWLTSLKVHPD